MTLRRPPEAPHAPTPDARRQRVADPGRPLVARRLIGPGQLITTEDLLAQLAPRFGVTVLPVAPPSHHTVAGRILRHPPGRTAPAQAVLARCPELEALTGHVRSFAEIRTERQGHRLPEWPDAIRQEDLPGLHTLAAGIDREAAIAGLTLPWNSGVVEEHVNRIKMLTRQMFGRAGFALLRKRVLLSSWRDTASRASGPEPAKHEATVSTC